MPWHCLTVGPCLLLVVHSEGTGRLTSAVLVLTCRSVRSEGLHFPSPSATSWGPAAHDGPL
eukprot:13824731-Alexandrium_andersonii.AAC.1